MGNSFVIVVSIILVVQIVSICSFMRGLSVAKAGKVGKFFVRKKLVWGKSPKMLECEGERINISGLQELYVHGNSMKDYRILDGQRVFVKEFASDEQKNAIPDHPVVVFNIYNMPLQSRYKLRKFISYIDKADSVNWSNVYDNLRNRIKVSRDEFVRECEDKLRKSGDLSGRLVLSETYDDDTATYRYSLHPVSSLHGRVMYAA